MRAAFVGLLAVSGVLALATEARTEDRLTGALKVEQAVRANLLPFSPAYVTPKCLVPYPVCKFAYATVALVTSWEQLVLGGDMEGAKRALARGFEGPWLVQPKHVSGEAIWSTPAPVPLVSYFVTGRGNTGPEALDPFASAKRDDFEGDVLPP